MAIKLVAVDIDGTLLDSQGRLPDDNARAVRESVQRGIKIILITGRRWGMAKRVADWLDLTFPIIVHNGALTKSLLSAERMASQFIAPEVAVEILSKTEEFLEYTVLHRDSTSDGQTVIHASCQQNPIMTGYLGQLPQSVIQVDSLMEGIDSDLIQVMFAGPLPAMLGIEERLSGQGIAMKIRLTKTYYPAKNLGIIDILDKACSKRSALEFMTGYYGFLPEETMAIGDNHNDLEMLEYAGIGVIVANCVEELKGRGFEETLSNNDLGVARALERFVLCRQ